MCEAELIALTMNLHLLLPMRRLLQDIGKVFKVPNLDSPLCADESMTLTPMTESVIFEDNKATLKISMGATDVHSPRTKFLGIK